MKEFKIWLKYTNNSFQQILTNRYLVVIFMSGKILRIALFLIFLHFVFKGTNGIAGYSRDQIIFFYLSFNLVDSLAQLFFREVYRFRSLVISGNLDYVLVKPINPLVRVLLGGGDIMDLMMLVLIGIITLWFGLANITTNPFLWLFYLLMVFNGLLIAAAFHIFVLGVGVITTAIDHLIMVYRDFTSMLRIPVDLYIEPIRFLLTFAIPLGIMITFPAKSLMGLLSLQFIVISIAFSLVALFLSLKFWSWSLKRYSSASS